MNKARSGGRLVDPSYLLALEEVLDAAEIVIGAGMTSDRVTSLEKAIAEAARLEEAQDRFRTDAEIAEIGPRSLRRYEGPREPRLRPVPASAARARRRA